MARRNYGEADRILILLTRDYGRVSLLAKGVRKPKSRKRGHLEVFSRVKFSAVKGKGLDLMIEAEMMDNYQAVRCSLAKTAVAFYLTEVLGKLLREGESHPDIFQVMTDYLQQLETRNDLRNLRLEFIFQVLIHLGFWPVDKVLTNHDQVLEEVVERQLNSARVGRKMLE